MNNKDWFESRCNYARLLGQIKHSANQAEEMLYSAMNTGDPALREGLDNAAHQAFMHLGVIVDELDEFISTRKC